MKCMIPIPAAFSSTTAPEPRNLNYRIFFFIFYFNNVREIFYCG